MVFLDTNAFYYAAELSNGNVDVEKLKNYISKNEVAISSVTWYEFLVKYKAEVDVIHKGSIFLADNHIKIAYNKYFPWREELRCDFASISEKDLGEVVKTILSDKVDVESRFAAIMYNLMFFSGLYFYYMPEGDKASDIKRYIFETCFKLFALNSLEVFQNIFKEGYNTDNCEKYVKNAIKNLLEFSFSIVLPLLDATEKITSEDEFKALVEKFNFMELADKRSRKIKKCDSSIVYMSKMATKYNTCCSGNLNDYLDNLSQPIVNKIPERAMQEYIKEIASRSCQNGSPFLKNDILDAIILCNIESKYQLITFDNGVKAHMKKYGADRPTYKSSLQLINTFEK